MTTGTGKHGHKDSQEPWPHHEGREGDRDSQQAKGSGESERKSSSSEGQSSSSQGGGSESLKDREYRDEQGNVHHHTKTYMDQHGKE